MIVKVIYVWFFHIFLKIKLKFLGLYPVPLSGTNFPFRSVMFRPYASGMERSLIRDSIRRIRPVYPVPLRSNYWNIGTVPFHSSYWNLGSIPFHFSYWNLGTVLFRSRYWNLGFIPFQLLESRFHPVPFQLVESRFHPVPFQLVESRLYPAPFQLLESQIPSRSVPFHGITIP